MGSVMTAIIYSMDARSASRRMAQIVNDREQIGMRLEAARVAAGLSNAELCRLTGLPSSQVSQYESGLYRPGYEAVAVMLPHIDVTFDYILLGRWDGLPHRKVMQLQNAWEQVLEARAHKSVNAPPSGRASGA
jgi:transcriptional regulator with XRE-family HTH domain